MDSETRKPLGLCLSGGGAIGLAHIGVLLGSQEQRQEPGSLGCSLSQYSWSV